MFAKTKLSEIKALEICNDSSGSSGFLNWSTEFDAVTVGNVSLRRLTLRTEYHAAGAAMNETFVTYLDR